MVDLWRCYLPLAEWILQEKRRHGTTRLFVLGISGSPGSGKSVLADMVAFVLGQLMDVRIEGRPLARSGDCWYLDRARRDLLRSDGYEPGIAGVSNRSLPGTHDLDWLRRNLAEMESGAEDAVMRIGNFDKRLDDYPPHARHVEVRGRVGVFLFDLWVAGAAIDVDPLELPDGLRRRVAENL